MIKSPQHITLKVMLWAFLICLPLYSFPQAVIQGKCGTALILAEKFQEQTHYQERKFEQWLGAKRAYLSSQRNNNDILQVPVVFHVIHKGEIVGSGLNISKETIDRQLVTLNEDFNQRNPDTSSTLSEFINLAANMEIEFVYAKQSPEGYPTNGIIRQVGNQSTYSYQERETLASESFWPPEDYLNIWIMDIRSPGLGWAEFPSTSLAGIDEGNIKANADGIAIDYQYVGDNPNSPTFASKGRTLTHEMGHFFGLRHIWGDGGCNVDDYCEDTPTASESSSGCDLTKTTCSSLDMVQNFMDYTNDICMTIFTQDQKLRVKTVLENSPRRVTLINSKALSEPPVFAYDAGILLTKPSAYRSSCANTYTPSILIRNLGTDSLNAFSVRLYTGNNLLETINITEQPLASGAETKVFFSELLIENILENTLRYKVTITGFPDERTENNEKLEFIQALNRQNLPYDVAFANTIDNWFIRNPDNKEEWVQSTTGIYLPTFKNRANIGQTDALLSPIFDFSTISIPELSIIYGQSDDSIQNRFSIYASYDCGETFQDLIFASATDALVTAYYKDIDFFPSYRLDWDTLTIDLAKMRNETSVSFKIEVENRGANNFHINSLKVQESSRKDRELTPIAWNLVNTLICNQPLSGELIVKNTGRSTISSFNLSIREGQFILFNEVISTVILSQQLKTIRIPELSIFEERGTLTATIEITSDDQSSTKSILLPYQYTCAEELPPVRFDLAVNSENNLAVFNPNNDETWQYDTQVNMLSSNSTQIKVEDTEDWLISPIIDVRALDYISLIFDVAYHKPFKQSEELSIILQPVDSIYSEKVIYEKIGDSLATSFGNNPEATIVTRNELVDLSPFLYYQKFRLLFKARHHKGANIYINDISIFLGQNLPPDYPQTTKAFIIYPNPVKNGQLNLHFNLPLAEPGIITITDAHGRVIRRFEQPKILNQFVQLNFSGLSSGLYLLHFNSPSIKRTAKFIIE
jgi:hypothetical protein